MKYKKWLIHTIFILPYLFDSAAILSSSFISGASVNKAKVRNVLTTYERCTVFQMIISIMVLTELVQHCHHALRGLSSYPNGIILTICSSQGFQYTHIDQFNKGLIWCFPTKTEMAQYINLCLPSIFL
jgi:alpha-N-acetylglucosamine transferase